MAQVNSCVDGYNLAVIKNRVSAGAFNLDQIKLPTMIKAADGGETIEVIGEDEPIVINQGEVCYFDQIGPYNLDLNFRDAIRTAVDSDTKNLLINVEGVYDITRQQVEKTLQEVLDNITKYCGGKIKTAGIYQANRKS
jgi:DNA/RNA-binding domain of Phe-tRNA-synthetase-like protein